MSKLKSKQQVRCRFRTGDEVQVMVGKSRGERGKIEKIDFKKQRVFVAGANIFKRHTKPNSEQGEGGIVDKAMSVAWSNVQIIDPKTDKPTRIGMEIKDKVKVRIARGSGTAIKS